MLIPFFEECEFDFRCYKVKIILDYHLPTEIVIQYLETKWDACEAIVRDPNYGDDGKIVLFLNLSIPAGHTMICQDGMVDHKNLK